jgi:hypothetical protein
MNRCICFRTTLGKIHNLDWRWQVIQKDGDVQEVFTFKPRQHLETFMTAGLSWSSSALNTGNVDVEPSRKRISRSHGTKIWNFLLHANVQLTTGKASSGSWGRHSWVTSITVHSIWLIVNPTFWGPKEEFAIAGDASRCRIDYSSRYSIPPLFPLYPWSLAQFIRELNPCISSQALAFETQMMKPGCFASPRRPTPLLPVRHPSPQTGETNHYEYHSKLIAVAVRTIHWNMLLST